MATESTEPWRWAMNQWENNAGYPSAVISGIVPDLRHRKNGGYHVSVEDLAAYGNAGDYSNRRTLDKTPPVTKGGKRYAAAGDMSMSRADMKTLYGRAKRVYDDRADPRRKYLNAINVWDGVDGHAPRRLDFQANTNSTASADHTWHSHGDMPRAYIDVNRSLTEAWTAAKAFVSMVKGETPAQWQASIGQGEDEDLKTDERQWLKDVRDALCDPAKGFAIAPAKVKQPLAALLGHMAYPLLNDPGETGSGAYIAAWMRLVAERVGIDQVELAQISAAAREGAASAADGIVAAVTAKLPDNLGGMTREQVVGAVEEGVREAFAGGLAS